MKENKNICKPLIFLIAQKIFIWSFIYMFTFVYYRFDFLRATIQKEIDKHFFYLLQYKAFII